MHASNASNRLWDVVENDLHGFSKQQYSQQIDATYVEVYIYLIYISYINLSRMWFSIFLCVFLDSVYILFQLYGYVKC